MKRKTLLIPIIGLLATFGLGGSIGIVDTAEAGSSESHSRHSLAGRSFQIVGTYVFWDESIGGPDVPPDFDNCYTFNEDGVFIDPKFPDPTNSQDNPAGAIPGNWIQHTGGFFTRYTAFAIGVDLFGDGIDLQLIQNGVVIPTWRRGALKLNAYSTVLIAGDTLGVVLSKGRSVESCDLD